jgi:hypothetical protein
VRGALGIAALGLLAQACALGPGEPLGLLEDPTLSARYVQDAPGREAGGGFQRLASDYQVRVTAATLEVGPLALVAREGGGDATFDPANPPAGYSLCHNGHCHADDGRLVDYDDILAEQGGGAAARTVVSLVPPPLPDLAGPQAAVALACEPACLIASPAEVREVGAPLRRLALTGVVRDGRAPARFAGEVPFTLDVALPAGDGGLALVSDVDLPVGREHPPRIRMALALELGPSLFDGVDWAAAGAGASPGTPLAVAAGVPATQAAHARILEALAEQPLKSDVRRSSGP